MKFEIRGLHWLMIACASLLATGCQYGADAVPQKYSTAKLSVGADYLHQMDGQSRWPAGKHIRVYVAPAAAKYRSMVADSFNQWQRAGGGQFNWSFAPGSGCADYIVNWTTKTRTVSAGDETGITTTDVQINPYTGQQLIEKARTRILTCYRGRSINDQEVARTILHEVGHGLGLEGHSSNPRDIMYYAVSSKQTSCLTARDANTLARLYSAATSPVATVGYAQNYNRSATQANTYVQNYNRSATRANAYVQNYSRSKGRGR
jgi:predicted Zn-dependent protease